MHVENGVLSRYDSSVLHSWGFCCSGSFTLTCTLWYGDRPRLPSLIPSRLSARTLENLLLSLPFLSPMRVVRGRSMVAAPGQGEWFFNIGVTDNCF